MLKSKFSILFSAAKSLAGLATPAGKAVEIVDTARKLAPAARIVLPAAITIVKTGYQILKKVPYRRIGGGIIGFVGRIRKK